MSKRLFGTDGIRGVAGEPPLNAPGTRRFGAALAEELGAGLGRPPRVLLGRDTRESGPWLRDAVARGITACGGTAEDAGVIPTPGLAWALSASSFDAGVMISASHNPFRDNGLKAFDGNGEKLSDAVETRIEARILDDDAADPGESHSHVPHRPDWVNGYLDHLRSLVTPSDRLKGMRLALDCANGAATGHAARVLGDLGAELICIGDQPNGCNINLDCGSLHLDRLASVVRDRDCSLGLAFDGDADRCLAVDRRGRVVDGDYILYLTGRRLLRQNHLRRNGIVATIMSNLWLEQRLREEGVTLHRAPVGDKYVLEQMIENDLVLGGEQSGHIIFREHATTGDGILTGLLLLDTLLDEPEPLEAILDGIVPCPQVQLNVAVRDKPDLRSHPAVGPAVADVERALGDDGRVVLRYSGTEPVARVMVEGVDRDLVKRQAEGLADVIRKELGS